MGMFDSVIAYCPECGEDVEFQSKAGECTLLRYHYTNVPIKIAGDINGSLATCRSCGNVISLICNPRVKMRIDDSTDNCVIGEWD